MIASDSLLLQAILEQPTTLAATTARRLAHFTRRHFDPRSEGSLDVATTLLRAALMARGAERRIPNLPPIKAHPIAPPKYLNTAANLANFGLWFRANQPHCWNYWCALEDAAGADAERPDAPDEFWTFARIQFDREVLCNGGQL